MQTWTQKYLKEAITDEIELARLLGYGKVARPATLNQYTTLSRANNARTGQGMLSVSGGAPTSMVPQWRRNWSAAGPLIGKLALKISHDTDEGTVSVGATDRRRSVTELYQDHPSVDAAIWTAIVRASIQLIAEQREAH